MTNQMNIITEQIRTKYGENLEAIISYSGNRLLFVFKEINIDLLAEISQMIKKLNKSGFLTLLLTSEQIRGSQDVFPLEYIRIKSGYKIIHGNDILSDLTISRENIRLEAEQKIKGALIRLTQIVIECKKNTSHLKKAAFLALEEIEEGLSGALILNNIEPEGDLFTLAEDKLDVDISAIKNIYDWKKGKKPDDKNKALYDFYENIESLAEYIDKVSV